MGDDDKPFACNEPGCGNRFATEDHLNMHKLKHSMSLALSSGNVSAKLSSAIFADQTPTPTKFLKYGEEIGLFNELTKSPFDEAFRKANTNDQVPLPGPGYNVTLHTPVPGLPSPQTEAPPIAAPTPEFIPLPGPTEVGSTLDTPNLNKVASLGSAVTSSSGDLRVTSSTASPAKKRTRFPLAEDSTHKLLAAQTTKLAPPVNVPEEIITVDDDGSQSEEELVVDGPFSVQSTDELLSDDSSSVPVSTPLQLIAPKVPRASVTTIQSQQAVTAPPVVLPALTSTTASTVTVAAPALAATGGNVATIVKQDATTVTTHVMQVLLQLPGGQTVPVQIPAAIAPQAVAPIVTQAVAAPSPSSATSTKSFVNKQEPSSSTPNKKVNASASTKQKLKATLTQNSPQGGASLKTLQQQPQPNISVLGGNMHVMTEAVDRITAQPARSVTILKSPLTTMPVGGSQVIIQTGQGTGLSLPPAAATGLSLSLPPATAPTPPLQQPPRAASVGSVVFTPAGHVQTQAADTSTPFPGGAMKRPRKGSEDDPDERRRKFLERNRAAAARCRMKRKSWIGNLEYKAEELQGNNSKLQTEVNLLRGEVAQLKTLLLAHKDCPIFTQQRESGQISLESSSLDTDNVFKEEIPTPTQIPPTPRIISAAASSSGILSLQGPFTALPAGQTIAILQSPDKNS